MPEHLQVKHLRTLSRQRTCLIHKGLIVFSQNSFTQLLLLQLIHIEHDKFIMIVTFQALFATEHSFVLFNIVFVCIVRYVILWFVCVQNGALLAKILLHGSFTAFFDSQLLQVRTAVVCRWRFIVIIGADYCCVKSGGTCLRGLLRWLCLVLQRRHDQIRHRTPYIQTRMWIFHKLRRTSLRICQNTFISRLQLMCILHLSILLTIAIVLHNLDSGICHSGWSFCNRSLIFERI